MKSKLIAISLLAVGCSLASAQSRSSFVSVNSISQIALTRTGLSLDLVVGANPEVQIGAITYQVTEVFGAWLLDDNDDLDGTGTNSGGWTFDKSTTGAGGILGFKTNPNSGVLPSQNKTFTFSTVTGMEETVGYHVRFSQNLPSGFNTLYVTAGSAVPEPASLLALGCGVLAVVRRRRK